MAGPELIIYQDPEELAAGAAERILRSAAESIAARGRFTLCLTGGSTPRKTYALLAEQHGSAAGTRHISPDTELPAEGEEYDLWPRTFLFFGDERFVPADDDRSNEKMFRESLLENAPIAADHVFAIPTYLPTPQQAAEAYAQTLKTFFGGVAWPEFDLVLLGLGEDGHTASLFPGSAALRVTDRWVTSSPPGTLPPPVDRVTLTFPVFNAARQVMFLVSGGTRLRPLPTFIRAGSRSISDRPQVFVQQAGARSGWSIGRPVGPFCRKGRMCYDPVEGPKFFERFGTR